MDNFSQMVDILKSNADIGQIALKAEFESEGTRYSELLRLKEIAHGANLPMVVKIGGCEAIRDLLDCKDLRISNIVAPMIESKYAASKFVQAINRVFKDEKFVPKTYINIETKTGKENFDEIILELKNNVDGVVMGRVDYVGSCNLSRDSVNCDKLLNDSSCLANTCLKNDIEFVVGGGISNDAIPFLKKLKSIKLNRFETRKCVFEAKSLDRDDITLALRNAVLFELLWLKSKQSYNSKMIEEDLTRIKMLEKRHLYNISACS